MGNKRNRWFKSLLEEIESVEQSHLAVLDVKEIRTRADRYWEERQKMLPKDRICPQCGQLRLKSAQWVGVAGICKSCYQVAEVEGDLPVLNISPWGRWRVWIPDPSVTVREYAEGFGVSATAVQRWKDARKIPVDKAVRVRGCSDGNVISTHMQIEGIRSLPGALGVSAKTFGEMIGYRRWRDGLVPLRSYEALLRHFERLSLTLQRSSS